MGQAIPIQNLYYLFCYAWNRLEEAEVIDIGGVESPELADLFAKVLISGLRHLLRRGIDREYISVEQTIPVLRGRINFRESMNLIVRRAPRLACEYDELRVDTPNNQILKATVLRLMRTKGIDKGLAHELRVLATNLDGVSEIRLSKQQFRQVQIHRNNAFYDFLLKVCELVYDAMLPEGQGDNFRFTDILRDERKMALVFQDFVKNFLRIEQSEFRVTPLQMKWDASSEDESDLKHLPVMRTDVHLERDDHRIIIDTKYYAETLKEYHGKESLKAGDLYQLFSYVKNAEALGSNYSDVEGMLLYPTTSHELGLNLEIQGHRVRIETINLNQPWQNIRSDLLALFARPSPQLPLRADTNSVH